MKPSRGPDLAHSGMTCRAEPGRVRVKGRDRGAAVPIQGRGAVVGAAEDQAPVPRSRAAEHHSQPAPGALQASGGLEQPLAETAQVPSPRRGARSSGARNRCSSS